MSKAQDQLAEDSRLQQCFGSWDFRTSKGFGTAEPDDVFVLEGFIEASLMWPDRLKVLRFGAEFWGSGVRVVWGLGLRVRKEGYHEEGCAGS